MNSSHSDSQLLIIVPESTQQGQSEYSDREGAETQGLKEYFQKTLGFIPVEKNHVKESLAKCVAQLYDILGDLKPIKNWTAEEVTVSLAVSAEGSIGLVTAGVESTIEIKFKLNTKTEEEKK